MAATGVLAQAYSNVVTRLQAAGLVVVTDPRNARPMSVFVELPSADVFNSNIVDVTITMRILAAPPGNQDSADYLLTTANTIHQALGGITTVGPSTALIGDQNVPAYDMTARVATRRT